jgi:ArsR family transcriptional regulator
MEENKEIILLDNAEDIEKAAKALKAMAHPLRLKILCSIRENEVPVLEIVEKSGSSQSNVSQHIEILRNEGIVISRKEGNKVLCSVKDKKILLLIQSMQSVFCSK